MLRRIELHHVILADGNKCWPSRNTFPETGSLLEMLEIRALEEKQTEEASGR